jgi:hypothetical protein
VSSPSPHSAGGGDAVADSGWLPNPFVLRPNAAHGTGEALVDLEGTKPGVGDAVRSRDASTSWPRAAPTFENIGAGPTALSFTAVPLSGLSSFSPGGPVRDRVFSRVRIWNGIAAEGAGVSPTVGKVVEIVEGPVNVNPSMASNPGDERPKPELRLLDAFSAASLAPALPIEGSLPGL